jgi:hypothetical protein
VGIEDDVACGWRWGVELEDSGGARAVDHRWQLGVTPRVMEGLIMLIKSQLSPNVRLNHDTKVFNQIQRPI